MTLYQIIYNIRNLVKDSKSDDLKLSDRQYEFIVNYLREKLIVQQLQKGRSISSNIKQDLGVIELEKVDRSEDEIISKRYVLKSKVQIPQTIELDQKDLLTYVGGTDKQSPIAFKTKSYASRVKNLKYSSKEMVAYLTDGYLYISGCSNPNLKYINVEGVFLSPRDVYNFKREDGSPCYNPSTDRYPISGRMIDMINDLIKSKEFNLLYQIPEDLTNDSLAN